MPATRRLVLDLPEEIADAIAAHVSSGEFTDAAHVVAASVERLPGAAAADIGDLDEDLPEWRAILAESDEAERRIDTGLERASSLDEVFDRLEARARARAARREAS